LLQLRFIEAQDKNNGAAGVARGVTNSIIKSSSQPEFKPQTQSALQRSRPYGMRENMRSMVELTPIHYTPGKNISKKVPGGLHDKFDSFNNAQFDPVVIGN